MIKNLPVKVTFDERDDITCGRLNEQEKMEKLDYFDISPFPELIAAYGEKPADIYLLLPTNDLALNFDCWFQRWGKKEGGVGVKVSQCDGENCVFRVPYSIGDKKFEAGEEVPCICPGIDAKIEETDESASPEIIKALKGKKCKAYAWLKGWALDPKTFKPIQTLCYRFTTHSVNSAGAVKTEIEKVQFMNQGVLLGVIFKLSVRMVQSATDNKKRYPLWSLVATTPTHQLQSPKQEDAPPANALQAPLIDILKSEIDENARANGTKAALYEWGENNKERISKLSAKDRAELELYYKKQSSLLKE